MTTIILTTNKKCYKVYEDKKDGTKYIRIKKTKTTLASMRGKYRYVKQQKGGQPLSLVMYANGSRQRIEGTYTVSGKNIPFFRKYFNGEIDGSANEQAIVKLIKEQQDAGNFLDLIRIFEITDDYYDAELLETYAQDETRLFPDIKHQLDRLHELHIVYIDIKQDNMGISSIDHKWKLFDFDSSGICNDAGQSWKMEAPFHIYYKMAFNTYFDLKQEDVFYIKKGQGEIKPLYEIDHILYEMFKKGET